MAPAARNASKNHHSQPKNSHRGGIKKRSPQARIEKDGDLVMEGVGETRGRPAQTLRLGAHATRVSSRNKLVNGRDIAKAIGRNLSDPRSFNIRDAPRGPKRNRSPPPQNQIDNYDQIVVRGWKQSEAAKNTDQGIPQLIAFMDRKASRTDNLKIIQEVSQHINSVQLAILLHLSSTVRFRSTDKTIKRRPIIQISSVLAA